MAHLAAEKFSQEVLDPVREHGRDNMQLAVHKVMLVGLPAPESLEFEVMEGDELTEKAFVIKGTDEIKVLRQSCLRNRGARHGRCGPLWRAFRADERG